MTNSEDYANKMFAHQEFRNVIFFNQLFLKRNFGIDNGWKIFSLSISPLHFVNLLAIHMVGILFLPLFKDFLTFQYQGIGHMTNGIFHVLGLGIFHSSYEQLHDIGMHLGLVCKCSAFTIHLLLTYKKKVRIF